MSDIRFNQWLHQSGTGGVSQVDGGHVGIGTTNPDIAVHSANAKKLNVGIVTANSVYSGNYYGNGSNLTGLASDKIEEGDTKVEVVDAGSAYIVGEVNGGEKIRVTSTGQLLVGTNSGGGTLRVFGSSGRIIIGDSSVNYYDGDTHIFRNYAASEKLRITSAGHVEPATDDAYNLGSSSKRWANIYSADLNLSNEGSKNDVDGTWGQYTIQEGKDNLYLINKRNGKKYKFLLQEVS
tara:strand:+ start:1759 stop:2466 length:708 start_codon:yes stop_codon:yes gene_type:complete